MRLIIRGEVTPIERIAINEALEAHKKKYNRTGIIVSHKIKIGKNIYPVEIETVVNHIWSLCVTKGKDYECTGNGKRTKANSKGMLNRTQKPRNTQRQTNHSNPR